MTTPIPGAPDPRFLQAMEDAPRLDKYLADALGVSRVQVQSWIASGRVLVAGAASKARTPVRAGDAIEVRIPPPAAPAVQPEAIPLAVLYEDDHLIVIDKPRGMVVHAGAGVREGTLVNALLGHCGRLSGIGAPLRPGIVHRLDKDTTGVLVAAKTDATHLGLTSLIESRQFLKEYLALVHGTPAHERAVIEAPIGRHPANPTRMAVRPSGRAATTTFEVEERFPGYTLLRIGLITGRTHQIRVHLSSVGLPVVGDAAYGRRPNPFGLTGQALHAERLAFTHPITGAPVDVHAPLPADFAAALAQLRAKA